MGVLIIFIPIGVLEGERRLGKNPFLLAKRTTLDYLSAKAIEVAQRHQNKRWHPILRDWSTYSNIWVY